ncbi:MAG: hypothetical protein ACXWM7_06165 [Parachlamydiaceae bacterium]
MKKNRACTSVELSCELGDILRVEMRGSNNNNVSPGRYEDTSVSPAIKIARIS